MTAPRRVAIGKEYVTLRKDSVRIDAAEIEHRRIHAVLTHVRER